MDSEAKAMYPFSIFFLGWLIQGCVLIVTPCTHAQQGVECLVCLCLFVHHFLACSRVQDTFKSSLYSNGFCVVICSALQMQSSSTMLLQCLCTESEVCTRTGYQLYELLL